MCNAYAPNLVGVAFLVSELWPFLNAFKTAKISLQTMDYSPWGSKIRIGSKMYASRDCREMHASQFWWAWPPVSEILSLFMVFFL